MEKEINIQELVDKGYADGKRSFDVCVKEIFESFNFQNVHKSMIATDWTWVLGKDENGNDNKGVPSVETIMNHAFNLLKQAYDEEKQISTGGFSCGIDSGELFLVFSLEENSTSLHTKTEDY